MADSSSPGTSHTLSAAYDAPHAEPFRVESSFPAPTSTSVEDKSKSLANLRASITEVQADINRRLTANMEADKAREAAETGKPVVDDVKEEENYGEEVVNEDD